MNGERKKVYKRRFERGTCTGCHERRELRSNNQCKDCNLSQGLKQCVTCDTILPVGAFEPKIRRCRQCQSQWKNSRDRICNKPFTSLAVSAPQLRCEWHPTKNGALSFNDTPAGRNTLQWWKCSICGLEWEASPGNRALRGRGCPGCSGHKLSTRNSLASKAPQLRSEWSKKNPISFDEVFWSSGVVYIWECPVGHETKAPPNYRTGKGKIHGCPICVKNSKLLATKSPHLRCEWHPTRNGTLSFDELYNSSTTVVWWMCRFGHEWDTTPANRTNPHLMTGCPWCSNVHSKAELQIYQQVLVVYPDAMSGCKGLLPNKMFELDIYVPSLHRAVEYDGRYYHARPEQIERDIRKDQQCALAGIELLRVQENDYRRDPSGTTLQVLEWLARPASLVPTASDVPVPVPLASAVVPSL